MRWIVNLWDAIFLNFQTFKSCGNVTTSKSRLIGFEWCFKRGLFGCNWFSIFLITFPFILSLHISLKFSIESSKGIYSLFLNSFPYWTTYIICNDFLTLNQLNRFSRCINLGDLIALLGSIDFVLGSIDLAATARFNHSYIIFLLRLNREELYFIVLVFLMDLLGLFIVSLFYMHYSFPINPSNPIKRSDCCKKNRSNNAAKAALKEPQSLQLSLSLFFFFCDWL